jgi:uncharacterized protein (TIGR02466 family)
MAMERQLANLFETPVILDTVADFVPLNTALKQAILARHESHPGVKKSNWNGWQSDTDMLDWGGPTAKRIADHFVTLCNNFSVLSSPDLLWSIEMWANVADTGAANEAHCHPGAAWSAVYYVDDGYEGSSDPATGGDLVLYDPRMPFVRMLPYDLRYRRPDGKGAESQSAVRPSSGRFVMFPPWLVHSVLPFYGSGQRISIAMNAYVLPAPQ